jgi:hypothetical protein
MSKGHIPFWERLSCSIDEAKSATSFGRTKLYELIASGRLQSRLVDGRRVISVASLRQLVEGREVLTAA